MDRSDLTKLAADLDDRLASVSESIREHRRILPSLMGNDVLLARQMLDTLVQHQETLSKLLERLRDALPKTLH